MIIDSANSSWIDLPTIIQLNAIHGFSAPKAISEEIAYYHSIPKTDLNNISARMGSLLRVVFSCATTQSTEHANEVLENISRIASSKQDYLGTLSGLYSNGVLVDSSEIYDVEKVREHFLDGANPNYIPLFLNSKTYFDTKLGISWGEFWLEAIDPGHRQLDNQKYKWLLSHDKDPSPFFLWLEDQWINESDSTKYFTSAELVSKKIRIIDGIFYDHSNKKITTLPSDEFIFIIDRNEDIYGAISSKSVRHVSLSLGKPIIAAGILHLEDGHLVKLESNSGHYLPTSQHALQLIDFVRLQGVQIEEFIPFALYKDLNKIETNVGDFEKNNRSSKAYLISDLPPPRFSI